MTYRMTSRVDPDTTRAAIVAEFRKWRTKGWGEGDVSDYNFPLKLDKGDSAASVAFVLRGKEVTVHCNSQHRHRDNLRCVFYAVQAMRMNELRGIADTMANAYAQLAGPTARRDPYEVLSVHPKADMAIIDAAYRIAAKRAHSDVGGSDEAMKELNDALDRIKAERGSA